MRKYSTNNHPVVMGILNATPDSFSGDGLLNVDHLVKRGEKMIRDGASILDIGGESSRPFAKPISIDEEINRVVPVIQELSLRVSVPLSIDTFHPETAQAALEAGALIINDISGFRDPEMVKVAVDYGVDVIVMHMLETPGTMQSSPRYKDVVEDISTYLSSQASMLVAAGVSPDSIILDPGIGFGKTTEHNLLLLRHLDRLQTLGYPILIGPSRKSFIGEILDTPENERLEGTLAAVAAGLNRGANIVRVHDVKQVSRFIRIHELIRGSVLIPDTLK